jgi:hypothetical protein
VALPAYVKAFRRMRHPLSETMIAEMARLCRNRDKNRQWPTQSTDPIDPEIVAEVTGDPNWPRETWQNIRLATRSGSRGLSRKIPLSQLFQAYGCSYELTEEMIVAMAELHRQRDKDKQWPSRLSGVIDPEIVQAVTDDPYWQEESWVNINSAAHKQVRGLKRKSSLPQILRDHRCTYDITEELIVKIAKLYRARHPKRWWPSLSSDPIDPAIIQEATGDPHWQAETTNGLDQALSKGQRGLKRKSSLYKLLREHGCSYDLTEDMIADMAKLHRDRYGQWPSSPSGNIDPDIVLQVTGDPLWQEENWSNINHSAFLGGRGLPRKISVAVLLTERFPERRENGKHVQKKMRFQASFP